MQVLVFRWFVIVWVVFLSLREASCQFCPVKNNVIIHWWNYADYLFKDFESGKTTGSLPSILNKTLLSCCSSLILRYEEFHVFEDSEDLEDIIESNTTVDGIVLYLPVFNNDAPVFKEHHFVKLHKSNGIPIIMRNEDAKDEGSSFYDAVVEAKGLFFFGAALAGIAGIGIWVLEHRQFPNEFSANFFKGSWEGFWWATVTMTTVGYGDRKPQSVLGRVFGVIWMTTGLVIVSSFTAHITSAITGKNDIKFDDFNGQKVGIPLGSINFFDEAITASTTFAEYNGLKEMISALKKGHVDKLITYNFDEDRNRFIHLQETVNKDMDGMYPELRFVASLNIPFATGVVVGGNLTGAEKFMACWKKNIRKSKHQMKHYPKHRVLRLNAVESKLSQVFTITLIYISLGTFGVMFIIGASWEMYTRKYLNKISSRIRNNDNTNNNNNGVNFLRRNNGIIKVQPLQSTQEVTNVERLNLSTRK